MRLPSESLQWRDHKRIIKLSTKLSQKTTALNNYWLLSAFVKRADSTRSKGRSFQRIAISSKTSENCRMITTSLFPKAVCDDIWANSPPLRYSKAPQAQLRLSSLLVPPRPTAPPKPAIMIVPKKLLGTFLFWYRTERDPAQSRSAPYWFPIEDQKCTDCKIKS